MLNIQDKLVPPPKRTSPYAGQDYILNTNTCNVQGGHIVLQERPEDILKLAGY